MIALAVSGAIQSGSLLGRSDINAWGSWAILAIIGISINIASLKSLILNLRFVFLVDDDDWGESVIKADLSIIASLVGCDFISIGGVALINVSVTLLIIDLCASLTSLGFDQLAASHGSHIVIIKVEGHRLFFKLVEAEVLIVAVVVLVVVDSAAEVRNKRVILFHLSVCALAITDVPTTLAATPISVFIVPLSVGRWDESCNSEKFVLHF